MWSRDKESKKPIIHQGCLCSECWEKHVHEYEVPGWQAVAGPHFPFRGTGLGEETAQLGPYF